MPIINTQLFNQKKKTYKRLFIFGCSFSIYHWPTWANILHVDMPNVKFYNFARGGGGNLFIYSQIIAANQKYNFTEDDCIAVMWSTHGREDRYIENHWETPGNMWSQNIYDEKFVKKFVCVKGYLVRDLAIFKGSKIILNSFLSDTINMYSVPIDYDSKYLDNKNSINDLLVLYHDVVQDVTGTLYELNSDGHGGWINGHKYHWPGISSVDHPSKWFHDYHPNPSSYLTFLMHKGFDISTQTQDFVNNKIMPELKQLTHRDLIREWFINLYKQMYPEYEFHEQGVALETDKNKSRLP
jgi:hypothetical protein